MKKPPPTMKKPTKPSGLTDMLSKQKPTRPTGIPPDVLPNPFEGVGQPPRPPLPPKKKAP
jgi:hypothetical protein